MAFVANKVALVTGGASGIGFAITDHLLKNGAKGVGIVDTSAQNGTKAEKKFRDEYGDKVIFIQTDVTKKDELKAAFEKTIAKFKNLDIVVNNAGIMNEPDWKLTLTVNLEAVLSGTFMALDEYLPKYRSSEEGLIVNTASILGIDCMRTIPTYSATKSGVIALGRSLGHQEDYDKTHIRIITICPGYIDTPLVSAAINREGYTNHQPDPDSFISPDFVGEQVVCLMNEGKTGSVWVIEEMEAYAVNFPDRKDMKVV
ncbi:15-hydroxyprostaglandin dehydrogenase [NAD(+)] [Leptinotarsa decemlineata]|uniref:15-hydroxyprostaglandin dehydrogenase [NAD(+)] n=1 Tax=Leptinotarsa decemlineata TaxID=7539 RepID=UPI003D30B392